nr:unnamed protein product [Digitaria exilis]
MRLGDERGVGRSSSPGEACLVDLPWEEEAAAGHGLTGTGRRPRDTGQACAWEEGRGRRGEGDATKGGTGRGATGLGAKRQNPYVAGVA